MRLKTKIEDLKAYRRVITTILALSMVADYSVSIYAFQSEAETNRLVELRDAGYSKEQIMDQLDEEFYNTDGRYNTGGIDGKYLDGAIAPNGILAGTSSSGNTGDSKPSHTCSFDTETVTKESTCTEEGTMTYTCSCGETKTENLPLTDHDWQQTAEHEGNCIEKAKVDLACYNCGATSTLEFSYGGHAYEPSPDSTLPTCTKDGEQIKICSVCGDVWTYALPAKGHSWESKYTTDLEPTCTESGSSSIHCSERDATKDEIVLGAKGHIERTYRLAEPTFWSNGLDTVKCEVCYTHFRDITVVATGGNLRYVIIGAATLAICGSIATVIIIKKKRTNKG